MPILPRDAPLADFSDPLAMLVDCHRRIERFLGVLAKVAEGPAELDEERSLALERALIYFREALPRHTADEELSLVPRLARLARPTALETALARFERDHQELDLALKRAVELGNAWLARAQLAPHEKADFRHLATTLAARYPEHLSFEEEELFPLAREHLGPFDLLAIGVEMRARRDLR